LRRAFGLIIFISLFILFLSIASGGEEEKIVFVRDGYIWTINGDGTGEKKVTEGLSPVFSPDGKKILYSCSHYIWIKDLEDGKEYKLSDKEYSYDPLWISNKEAVYIEPLSGGCNIVKQNIDSKTKEVIVNVTSENLEISFTTSNGSICYAKPDGRGCSIYMIDGSGNNIPLPKLPKQVSEKIQGVCLYPEDYDEANSLLLTSLFELFAGARKGLWIMDLNKQEIINVASYNSDKELVHGRWDSSRKSIVALNTGRNLEKLFDFKESNSGGYKVLYPSGHAVLTTSGDVDNIVGVTDNKIFYTRKSGNPEKYYLWSIGIDGSSPEKIIGGEFREGRNVDIQYPGK